MGLAVSPAAETQGAGKPPLAPAAGLFAAAALIVGSASAAVVWLSAGPDSLAASIAATGLCTLVGAAALGAAWRLYPYDPMQGLAMVLWLMLGRMAAAVGLGFLIASSLPEPTKKVFWISLAAAYLATLAAETKTIAGWLRLSQSRGTINA